MWFFFLFCYREPPPKYQPSSVQDSSSTSSYYARVRSRQAERLRKAETNATSSSSTLDQVPSAPSSSTISRKFDTGNENQNRKSPSRKSRSKTIEITGYKTMEFKPPISLYTAPPAKLELTGSASSVSYSNIGTDSVKQPIKSIAGYSLSSNNPETVVNNMATKSIAGYSLSSNNTQETSELNKSKLVNDKSDTTSEIPINYGYVTNKAKQLPNWKTQYLNQETELNKSKLVSELEPLASTTEQDSLADKEVAYFLNQNSSKTASIITEVASPSECHSGRGSDIGPMTSLKVSEPTETKRLSPFNRFRSSLVMGRDSPKSKNSTPTTTPSAGEATPTRSSGADPAAPSSGGPHRKRTESETKNSEKPKGRFFYRKSRTGPLPGENGIEVTPTSSAASTTSNSASNLVGSAVHLTLSQEEVTSQTSLNRNNQDNRPCPDRFGIRAKSEFCPRTAANSTSNTGSDYVNGDGSTSGTTSGADGATSGAETGYTGTKKDNLIVTAAKRWASYDKPTYQTPFTRDNWKRSHRKFNYSRFLNYTRETFV